MAQCIESVPALETLLLLRAAAPERMTLERVARMIFVSEPAAAIVLTQLEESGLVASTAGDQFLYAPRTPELAAAVDQLARSYMTHLLPLTRLIHAKPGANVLAFADAFRIRKDK